MAAQVRFVRTDGSEASGELVLNGESVMAIARRAGIGEIVAECGGNLSCATCHVYVDRNWIERFPAPTPLEGAMLECVVGKADNSRLSCQLPMSPQLDGLIVHVPASQF